jgi:hypothetical protein
MVSFNDRAIVRSFLSKLNLVRDASDESFELIRRDLEV